MQGRPFVHLHCHSHYSLLDGAAKIDHLLDRVKSLGMNALAITDHGNLHGALEFYQKARAAGINPILGYEAYIAPGSRFAKDAGSMKESNYHLTLLAQNRTGFRNLVKLASAAFLEGFYFKPRIDKQLLEQHHEGIICLSGCASSEFSRAVLQGHGGEEQLVEAMEVARWFHHLFGDRYFIEIQNSGTEIQRLQLEGAVEVARRIGLPLVATNDTHYVDPEDADAQDVLLCVSTGKFRTDTNRMRMDGNEFYLRSPEQMYAAFPGLEDAVARSQEIADGIDIQLELGKRHFPLFDLPQGVTAEDYLRDLCLEGLKERYAGDEELCPGGQLSRLVLDRLDRELSVINKLGFPNYFLIVWDFVRKARELDIPATARGSGVGAIVCYALYLSHVCPIRYDLLFERFLDENRKEAPDIDIDFCQQRRGEIIRYVKEKYGEENVAQIGTFGTLAARAAIKDVGRALGIPLQRVNEISAMVPDVLKITIDQALEQNQDLRKLYETDGDARELLDFARKVEGLARNVGTHAAAVVIADKPLTEYVPLGRVTGKTDVITQWSMNDVEAAGLLKMDFLGLRNLTILSKAVEIIEQTTGKRIDPNRLPLDDKETFALLCRGETKGVFQLESGGIRDLLQRMRPDNFRDIIATNALYRPGPLEGGMVDDYVDVKHGRKRPEYKHPVLEEVLGETHGVMVYQEQVMRILNRLGGIPLANAYTCIKAISKKKESLINANREQFLAGAVERGLKPAEAQEIWDLIQKFAGYGFNKSHSTAYALIAYLTAFLKAHYPVEFMAALLSGDIPNRNFKKKDSLVEHLEDCRRMGVEVVPPDVNLSHTDFAVKDGKIVFGLSAIKGCGGAAAEAICAERQQGGPFTSLFDFCERVDPAACNRVAVETLIKAGAFDSLGARRAQLFDILDRAMQAGASKLADRRAGQKSLFDLLGGEDAAAPSVAAAASLPDIPELPERQRLLMEREVLGFYLSSHPLAEHQQTFANCCTHAIAEVSHLSHRTPVLLGGMLSAVVVKHVKRQRAGVSETRFASFDLEDMTESVRCNMWPERFAQFGHMVQGEAILAVRGFVERRNPGDEPNIDVHELIPLDALTRRSARGVILRIDESAHGPRVLPRLKEILRGYPGNLELKLVLRLHDGRRVTMRAGALRLANDPEMRARLDDLLGPGNCSLITAPVSQAETPPAAGSSRRH